MFLEELNKQLKEHAARFDLVNRAVSCCRQGLHTLIQEDPEETQFFLRGFSIEELEFFFDTHKFIFDPDGNAPRIWSRVIFGIPSRSWIYGVEPFGWYDFETAGDGEGTNDWLVWEQMRDEDGKLIEFSRF